MSPTVTLRIAYSQTCMTRTRLNSPVLVSNLANFYVSSPVFTETFSGSNLIPA